METDKCYELGLSAENGMLNIDQHTTAIALALSLALSETSGCPGLASCFLISGILQQAVKLGV